MAKAAADTLSRVRALGANIMLDGEKLRIINRAKLPPAAIAMIRDHARDIAALIEAEAEFEERAAILEYDGGLPRPQAEDLARILVANPPEGVEPADWTWFCGKAAEIIDRRAA
jgi:hypothetical protein